MQTVEQLKSKLLKLRGEQAILLRESQGNTAKITDLSSYLIDTAEARKIVQEVARLTQQQLEINISSIVSLALSTVFDDPYKFGVEFVLRRNKTECDLYFDSDGNRLEDMEEEAGIGAVDVGAFGLRCALLNMQDPPKRKFLALDEPFKHLRGEERQRRAGEMLKRISKDLGIQMLIVADVHFSMEADKRFHLTKTKKGVIVNV